MEPASRNYVNALGAFSDLVLTFSDLRAKSSQRAITSEAGNITGAARVTSNFARGDDHVAPPHRAPCIGRLHTSQGCCFLGPGAKYLASSSVHAKNWRPGIPSHARNLETGTRRAPPAAQRPSELPLLFLERPEFASGRGRDSGTNAFSSFQEIRREGRSRLPVSAYPGHATFGAGSHLRRDRRRPRKQSGGRAKALR